MFQFFGRRGVLILSTIILIKLFSQLLKESDCSRIDNHNSRWQTIVASWYKLNTGVVQ